MSINKFLLIIISFLISVNITNAATLGLSPGSGSYSRGEIFPVNILLDTEGAAIDGVDIVYLNYNPAHLEVQDDNASVFGIQISPGTLMAMTPANTVDQASGKITFSQITAGGTSFTNSGAQVLATVHFKVLEAVDTIVAFDFVSGGTADTNVASVGRDILTAVTNGSYGPLAEPLGPTSPTPTPPPPPSTIPTVITQQLSGPFGIGMTSDQVKLLQQMLVQDETIYPEGEITGYYGKLTQKAVERFQCKYNIVCSGTLDSNGYGLAGPITRIKLNEVFGGVVEDQEALKVQLRVQIKQLQQQLIQLLNQMIQLLRQKIETLS